MKRIMLILALVLALPFGVQAQDKMKIMFAGEFDFSSISGGAEANFILPLGGRWFGIAQVDANQAISGMDEDDHAQMYGFSGLIGANVLESESIRLAILGGPASQWYAFTHTSEPWSAEGLNRRTYVEAQFGVMFSWAVKDDLDLVLIGQYFNPVKENALKSSFDISFGVALPL